MRRFQHPYVRRSALYYISSTIAIYILLLLRPNLLSPNIFATKSSVLLVTAHPDDETLFFSPIITSILKSRTPFRILTLSKGDNYGKGVTREKEMNNACAIFQNWATTRNQGLPMDAPSEPIHCEVLDVLKDDPKAQWDEQIILKEVQEYTQKWKVDAIITFDEGGISGHENHKSIARALIHQAKAAPTITPVYTVYTTILFRKYTFLFDLPLTVFPFLSSNLAGLFRLSSWGEHALYVNSFETWRVAVRAFGKHESQFSWDRSLFLGLNSCFWFLLRLTASYVNDDVGYETKVARDAPRDDRIADNVDILAPSPELSSLMRDDLND